jgi:hypothetical protein
MKTLRWMIPVIAFVSIFIYLARKKTTAQIDVQVTNPLINEVDRMCTDDADCKVIFKNPCFKSACGCPSLAANKNWKPSCSVPGTLVEAPNPAIKCEPCPALTPKCVDRLCVAQ